MGIFVAILLALVAVGLFVATHKGYIVNSTLESLANIASIVALLAAIAVFVVPAATSESNQAQVEPAPSPAPAPTAAAPTDNALADTPQPAETAQPPIIMLREDVWDGGPIREDFSGIITGETVLPGRYRRLDGVEIQVYSGTGEVFFELVDRDDNFLFSLGPEPLQTTPMRRLGIGMENYVRIRIIPTENQTAVVSVIASSATDITPPGGSGDP